uniref:Phospholipase A1 n=1 Tax=Vespula vulgaris TaxID=7454 RepID=PA1_VESVU|nr:RecName: Full=Phospholipase A1; Short=PLA1; AltName: Full=Allergen Ves v I; AltName: Allergen=Ves v 1; Flags: Precursor [Vespula vulgaris]AAB48072.1 allergen and phospholipase A1 [Vespula vulgaris]
MEENMNLKYLLLFVYFVQVLNCCYGHGDPLSYELDRGPKCPFNSDTVSIIIETRENRNRDLYTLQTLQNHPEFKKKTITRPVVFITHGFTSSASETNFINLAKALVDKDNYMVISIDWQTAACTNEAAGLKYLYYPTAARNTRLVGQYIATITQKLVKHYKISMANIRLIGHSLGAHASGFAGKKVQELKLGKYSEIIGLDPARPSFDSNHCSERLCETDAEYVQIIHTSNYLGTEKTLGTVDFYMNNGKNQPGCGRFFSEVCSHSRAVIYMAECIKHECCLIGIPKSKSSQPISSCTKQECVCVGLNAKKYPSRGSFYVPVESTAPFCNNKGKII